MKGNFLLQIPHAVTISFLVPTFSYFLKTTCDVIAILMHAAI